MKSNAALKGIKVVDLSRLIAGPYCGVMLGISGRTSSRSGVSGGGTIPTALLPAMRHKGGGAIINMARPAGA